MPRTPPPRRPPRRRWPPPLPSPRRDGRSASGTYSVAIGVGSYGCRLAGCACRVSRGASAGADRHEGISVVVGAAWRDEPGARRVSSSSCRMIARGLTVDPGAIGVALGSRRRPARPSALHRADAAPRRDGSTAARRGSPAPSEHRRAGVGPCARHGGLGSFLAGGVQRAGRRRARRRRAPATISAIARRVVRRDRRRRQRRERRAPAAVAVGDRDPDPPLAEIEPEERLTGSAGARRRRPPGPRDAAGRSTAAVLDDDARPAIDASGSSRPSPARADRRRRRYGIEDGLRASADGLALDERD